MTCVMNADPHPPLTGHSMWMTCSEVDHYPSQRWSGEKKKEEQDYVATCFDIVFLFKALTQIKFLTEHRTIQRKGKGQILEVCHQHVSSVMGTE